MTERRASTDDELVDEASRESFPASDPPSFWAGPPRESPHDDDASDEPRPDA